MLFFSRFVCTRFNVFQKECVCFTDAKTWLYLWK